MLAPLKGGGKYAANLSRRILRVIYGPVNDNGIRRARCNTELYTVYREVDTVRVVEIGRLKWLGQLCRMQRNGSLQKGYCS